MVHRGLHTPLWSGTIFIVLVVCMGPLLLHWVTPARRAINSKSYYEILETPENSTPAMVELNYKRLLHRDGANPNRRVRIERAYAVLSDKQIRAAYDRLVQSGIAGDILYSQRRSQPDEQDYFARLGLKPNETSIGEIDFAYDWALVENAGDVLSLLKVGEAYETLENPAERDRYRRGDPLRHITESDRMAAGALANWLNGDRNNLSDFMEKVAPRFMGPNGTRSTALQANFWREFQMEYNSLLKYGGDQSALRPALEMVEASRKNLMALNPAQLTPGMRLAWEQQLIQMEHFRHDLAEALGVPVQPDAPPPPPPAPAKPKNWVISAMNACAKGFGELLKRVDPKQPEY